MNNKDDIPLFTIEELASGVYGNWLKEDQIKLKNKEIERHEMSNLEQAITLLKQCVNYDGEGMTTAISGELGDRIKEFIGRCGE